MMRIWVDIDNTPHVLFFEPLIKKFISRGHDVFVTARDYGNVLSLLYKSNVPYDRVGKYPGKHLYSKILGTLRRAYLLTKSVSEFQPTIAVNHGVRAAIIAARVLGIPCITMFDYEHSNKFLVYQFADKILVPEIMLDLARDSAQSYAFKVIGYPGLKEELYIYNFHPDRNFFQSVGINEENVIVTVRPPSFSAHYRNNLGEGLFYCLLRYLVRYPQVQIILLPRTKAQESEIQARIPREVSGKLYIPDRPLNAQQLIFNSDMVFSGGGTMVREAALLGVPAYSIFCGKVGRVDVYLAEQNRLKFIRNEMEFKNIRIGKRHKPQMVNKRGNELMTFLVKYIENFR